MSVKQWQKTRKEKKNENRILPISVSKLSKVSPTKEKPKNKKTLKQKSELQKKHMKTPSSKPTSKKKTKKPKPRFHSRISNQAMTSISAASMTSLKKVKWHTMLVWETPKRPNSKKSKKLKKTKKRHQKAKRKNNLSSNYKPATQTRKTNQRRPKTTSKFITESRISTKRLTSKKCAHAEHQWNITESKTTLQNIFHQTRLGFTKKTHANGVPTPIPKSAGNVNNTGDEHPRVRTMTKSEINKLTWHVCYTSDQFAAESMVQ